ncbi:hypothetical protein DENSPDRAFT_523140 [Dentipellis sp. KUC8613]|nr:hypothetical protein DENSPDRAFT_523140 [Dentipellis sp. KUC8613]
MMRSLISLRMQAHRSRGTTRRHQPPPESLFSTNLATETFASSTDLNSQLNDLWSSRFVGSTANLIPDSAVHLPLPETIPSSSSSTPLRSSGKAIDVHSSGPSSQRPAPPGAHRDWMQQRSPRDAGPIAVAPMPEVAHFDPFSRPSAEPEPLPTRAQAVDDDEAAFQRVRAVWGTDSRPDRFQPWYPVVDSYDEILAQRNEPSSAPGLSSWQQWLTDPYKDARITPPKQTLSPVPEPPPMLFGPHEVDTDSSWGSWGKLDNLPRSGPWLDDII